MSRSSSNNTAPHVGAFSFLEQPMYFGSVCSGIEAASIAFAPLGWRAAWLAEIDKFASAVLAHHYPDVPNLGDMTKIAARVRSGEIPAPDVFCGGTPCQSFSIAGLRKSLDDARGNLSLNFCEIANEIDSARLVRGEQPSIIFWENVPGVLSTKDNAFGCFLAGLAGEDDPLVPPGGKWTNAGCVLGPQRAVAWRLLDAQYFGVAQRRRRVFVVASARKGFDPATVLFEWDGVRRDSAPSREARQVAPTIPSRSTAGGGLGTDFDCDGGTICVATGQAGAEIGADMAPTLNCNHEAPYVAHSLRGEGFDASEDGTGRGTPLVPVHCREIAQTITSNYGKQVDSSDTALGPNIIAFDTTQITSATNRSNPQPGDPCHPLAAGAHAPSIAYAVRTANTSANGHGIATEVTHTLDCAQGVAVAQPVVHAIQAGALRVNPASGPDGIGVQADHAYTLEARSEVQAVAVALRGREGGGTAELGDEVQNCLRASSGGGDKPHVLTAMQVRRLTPTEAERLMGFPDGYTLIPWRKKPASECPDGPRYRSLGNSWAVPNVRWIGQRIDAAVRRLR